MVVLITSPRADILFHIFPAAFDTRHAWIHTIRCDKPFKAPIVQQRHLPLSAQIVFVKVTIPSFL